MERRIWLLNLTGKGSSFSTGGKGINDRPQDDFFATPEKTTEALLNNLKLEGSILEPACGQGHISEILKRYYPNSEIISTDLIDRGYGQGNIDFVTYDYNRRFDNVITNPPFKYAKEFVGRALQISNKYVIMLLKIQFLESKIRKEFLVNSPLKYIYVFSERQSTLKDGLEINPMNNKPWSTTLLLAWFIWEVGYEGEPVVRWL
jgi:adenine-specific DNA methylase